MNKKYLSKHLPLTEATYYILLSLVTPKHGYAVMQEAEEISADTVRLAPGTLYEAVTREIATDYVRRLLAAFPISEPEQADPLKIQTSKSAMIEPLSERELEVLVLVAEGLTNREIADKLYLSINTVKVHTRNIYGKLDAHHRAGAVARARAFGILPST